ncbi:hypothetical protein Q644_11300 [Brucella intermedia 229E]|uniref:BON domain-containing protein n=1 Tax=Brucella intermedia 229E TaxID=1337887 RepID=U4VGN8_9HYPH|nr:hypothetical protein Q644_11300 [Brucella intermedia 229E]
MRKTNRVRPYSARIALLAGALATVSLPLADMTAMAAAGIVKVGSQQRSQTIKLGLNKSVVLDLPQDAYDVLVSNPTIADAVTRTSRRIYLFGKQVGQTNIFVFGQNGEQVASIDVEIERDVSGLSSQLKRLIPGSDIRVELINDNVVLTGTVQTPQDSAQAAKLAGLFVSGGEATTGQYSTTASAPTDGGGVAINNPDWGGRRQSAIVNMLTIVGEDQVTLKVTVAEVSRSVMKQLGVNMTGSGVSNGISYGGGFPRISQAPLATTFPIPGSASRRATFPPICGRWNRQA